MHQRVQGTASDGRTYSAQDPRLLEWVHIALVDSMLSAYLHLGRDGEIDPDGYVADMAVVGERMGVVGPPRTQAELAECFAGFRPELRVDDHRHADPWLRDQRPPARWPCAPATGCWPARPGRPSRPGRWRCSGRPRASVGLDVAAADAALRVLRVALVASPARLAGERRLAGEVPTGGAPLRSG